MTDSASSSSPPDSPVDTPPSSIDIPNGTLKDISEQDKVEAARLKGDANKAFQRTLQPHRNTPFIHATIYLGHDFPVAATLYSRAINLNPTDPTIYCNRVSLL
jgi:serine/threonine-protein phosphatase 5